MHIPTRSMSLRRPFIALGAAGLALAGITLAISPSDAATDEPNNQGLHPPHAYGHTADPAHLSDLAATLGIDDEAFTTALDTLRQEMFDKRLALRASLGDAAPAERREAMRAITQAHKTAMTDLLAEFGIDRATLKAQLGDQGPRRGPHASHRRGMMHGAPVLPNA